ncbi:hypothetical protein ABIE50_004254 [Chitinophaga sp. OAE865]
MTLGEHIMLLCKQQGLSLADLGKQIGTFGDIIGRYERNPISCPLPLRKGCIIYL